MCYTPFIVLDFGTSDYIACYIAFVKPLRKAFFFFTFISKLKKLSEDSLTKQPEEVFDVLEKLGEG